MDNEPERKDRKDRGVGLHRGVLDKLRVHDLQRAFGQERIKGVQRAYDSGRLYATL
jgi:hypothetical protein